MGSYRYTFFGKRCDGFQGKVEARRLDLPTFERSPKDVYTGLSWEHLSRPSDFLDVRFRINHMLLMSWAGE
jgi:hypothetical protein